MIKIAIDPGPKSGCLVTYSNGLTEGWNILPFKKHDYYEINNILVNAKSASSRNNESLYVMIEKVHAFPGQGISSTAKLMENYGILKGLLMASKIPFKEIMPKSWMKHLPIIKKEGDSKIEWKKSLVQLARQQVPDIKFTNDNADAILMILYMEKYY